MSSIFFIAVKCCECAIMQVKQRKKMSKSNKWTCVVCNQKQSIRKVFAQGSVAKDLRLFVQSFNISHGQHQHPPSPDFPPLEDLPSKTPRTDWTEFLDPDEQIHKHIEIHDPNPGDEFEPEIVTELPMGLFKKAKLNGYSASPSEFKIKEGSDKLYKPVFSRRNGNKRVLSHDKEPRNHESTTAIETDASLKWSHKTREDDQKPRKGELTKAREASKWSDYITEVDEDVDAVKFSDHNAGDWSHNSLNTLTNEERVEDDIHPDFL